MEFLISDTYFPASINYKSIFYKGPLKEYRDRFVLLEGEIYNNEIDEIIHGEMDKSKVVYNIITLEKNNSIAIKNDIMGQYPLYIFNNEKKLVISNNMWSILDILDNNEIEIELENYKALFIFHRIPKIGATFIKNLKQLEPGATLSINLKTLEEKMLSIESFKQKPDNSLTIDDAIIQLDKDFMDLFSDLKEKYPNDTFGFGNSGGLDSRIIPEYASRVGINLVGFTFGQSKANPFLLTTSFHNAKKISKIYDFKQYNIEYTSQNYEDRLLLDIRNNPLSGQQILKNPYHKLPNFDRMFCGGNGFVVSNESGMWKKYEKIETEREQRLFLINYLLKKRTSMINKGFPESDDIALMDILSANPFFEPFFSDNDMNLYLDNYNQFLKDYSNYDSLSQMRKIHQAILNKQSPNGGYESVNRIKKTHYLYFPYPLYNTFKWNNSFFYDRILLKKLLEHINPKLLTVRDQKRNYVGDNLQNNNRFIKKLNKKVFRIEKKLRPSGIDYRNWIEDKSIQSFVSSHLKDYHSPFFSDVLPLENVKKLKNDLGILDVIKQKKIYDLLYHKDFTPLFDSDFDIASDFYE